MREHIVSWGGTNKQTDRQRTRNSRPYYLLGSLKAEPKMPEKCVLDRIDPFILAWMIMIMQSGAPINYIWRQKLLIFIYKLEWNPNDEMNLHLIMFISRDKEVHPL